MFAVKVTTTQQGIKCENDKQIKRKTKKQRDRFNIRKYVNRTQQHTAHHKMELAEIGIKRFGRESKKRGVQSNVWFTRVVGNLFPLLRVRFLRFSLFLFFYYYSVCAVWLCCRLDRAHHARNNKRMILACDMRIFSELSQFLYLRYIVVDV